MIRRAWAALVVVGVATGATVIGFAQKTENGATTPSRPSFTDVASAAGVAFRHTNDASAAKHLPEIMGSGGLFFDYDNDGWIDIFLVEGGPLSSRQPGAPIRHRLYRNRRDGTFQDVSAQAGIVRSAYGMGACAADYDGDAFTDLYVTQVGANALFHNNGDGTFSDVTRAAGVAAGLWSTSCAWADIDRDGDVDLFVARYVDWGLTNNKLCGQPASRAYCHPGVYRGLSNVLFRNDGGGRFADVTRAAGASATGKGLGAVFSDYDNDGWIDLFVANDSVPNLLFRNARGTLKEEALLAGVAVASDGQARSGMGTDFGDYDADGNLDLVVTNLDLQMHNVFRNLGGGLFSDATIATGVGKATLPYVGFGSVFLDYDNDGALDLAIVNGHVLDDEKHMRPNGTFAQKNLLFRNAGGGRFTDVSRGSGPGFALEKISRGLAVADVDNDGDLDLLVTNNGQAPDLLRNDGGNRNNAISVKLVGANGNRDAVGARLRLLIKGRDEVVREVKAGSGYLGQSDLRVHFGLNRATSIDRLEIRWPSGSVQTVLNPPVNRFVDIVERVGITNVRPFSGRAN